MADEDAVVLAAHVLAAGVSDQISLWVGIVVGLIAISTGVASVFGARRRATDRAKADLDAAFERGVRSRDDEVALLKSQRDDARVDRERSDRQLEMLQSGVLNYGRSLPPPLPPTTRPKPRDT